MNLNRSQKHSGASVLAMLVVPGVLMLITAVIGTLADKPPAKHLVIVLAVGVMWHSMGRRWLQKYAPEADVRLAARCLLTLFVTLPAAHLAVFGLMWLSDGLELNWGRIAFAALLGVSPLYAFYNHELKG